MTSQIFTSIFKWTQLRYNTMNIKIDGIFMDIENYTINNYKFLFALIYAVMNYNRDVTFGHIFFLF